MKPLNAAGGTLDYRFKRDYFPVWSMQ